MDRTIDTGIGENGHHVGNRPTSQLGTPYKGGTDERVHYPRKKTRKSLKGNIGFPVVITLNTERFLDGI